MTDMKTTRAESLEYAVPVQKPKSPLRFLVWAVGIVVIGGILISVMLPSLCRASETANRVKCASNLRQIGQAIELYAKDHGGQYPASLAELPGEEEIGSEVLTCPSSNAEKAV